eukprot:s488_g27.t1
MGVFPSKKEHFEHWKKGIKFSGSLNFSRPKAMEEAPKKRHRSKSAPESSANKRPSALRKPGTSSSSGSPSARIRDYLAEKKKERESSMTSASKSKEKKGKKEDKVIKGDKFSKTTVEKEKARKAQVDKENARKAGEKENARKAEEDKEKARKDQVEKEKVRKAEEKEKARKAECEKEKALKAQVEKEKARKRKAEEKEKARKAEEEKEKARKAEEKVKARKAECEKEKALKAQVDKENARKAGEKEKARKAEEEKEKVRKAEEKEKARKAECEKEKALKAQVDKEKARKAEEKEKARKAEEEKEKARKAEEKVKARKAEEEKEKRKEKANTEKIQKGKEDAKKEPPIKFIPSQKSKVEHIFSTPPTKSSRSDASLSSRERAEMHLQSLGALLEASDSEASSECSGMDDFLQDPENGKNGKDDETKEAEKPKTKDAAKTQEEEEEEDSSSETSSDADMGEGDEEEDEDDGPEPSEPNTDEKLESGDDLESEEDEQEEQDSNEEAKEDEEGDGKTPEVAAPADPADHALVAVTKATGEATTTLRNSSTNKREWDAFCRQLKANNRIPCQISEYAQTTANKTCLFGMWLDSGKDWTQCQLVLERSMKQKNEAERGWCAQQGHDIKKKYKNNPEKAEKVMSSRRAAGLWYADDDFPDDPDEAWYFMRVGNSFKKKDITSEGMTLKGSMDVDPNLRQALTDADEGIMRPGALPKMQTFSASGNKQLLDTLEKVTAAPKKKAKKEDEKSGAEEVKPQTWEEMAKDAMGELLLDAAKARTESIKLGNVPYAKELSGQLLEHASKLEGPYKSTEQAMQRGASEKEFKSLMGDISDATAFTAKAKVASAALLKPPSKPKGKKDSGKKAKGRAKNKAAS